MDSLENLLPDTGELDPLLQIDVILIKQQERKAISKVVDNIMLMESRNWRNKNLKR